MARSPSGNDKKQRRAIADLESHNKAIRRGQRPAVLKVVDTWLEVSAEVRAQHAEWVQSLVAKALDELDRRLIPRFDAGRARLAAQASPRVARADLERALASASWSGLVAALDPR